MSPTDTGIAQPRYWMHETSGVLAAAVRSYLDNPGAMTLREIAYMRAYLRQWIESPVWDQNPGHDAVTRAALAGLRQGIDGIASGKDISKWLHAALNEGHDPL